MKANISIVVEEKPIHLGDDFQVQVYLHVFRPIIISRVTLEVVCEKFKVPRRGYLKPAPMVLMFKNEKAFHDIFPGSKPLYHHEHDLSGPLEINPPDQRVFNQTVTIPVEALPTLLDAEIYRHWFLKCKIVRPNDPDIRAFNPFIVNPKRT